MKECVIVLDNKYKERLGQVRTVPGWKAAADEEQIWLRGPVDNGKMQTALSSLPATASYLMDEQFRLFPYGKRTPVLTLKELEWQSLANFIAVTLPVSAMPGAVPQPIKIRLSRSADVQPAFALLTTVAAWKNYVESAPLIRLKQLKFAVSAAGQVLITGQPLPPVKGTGYWLNKNMMIPAGYQLDPPLMADLIGNENLVLFHIDGRREVISSSCFNAAERNLIRQNG
jgi:hypothetical protein